jgi:NCS1 family nucleobase:cation symporter-1
MIVGALAFNVLGGGSVFGANPTADFTKTLGGFGGITLLAITIGSISANVLNVYSGAMSFLAMGINIGFKTRRAIMVALAGLIGGLVAFAGVQNGDVGHALENFLLVVSYWVAPWIAIVLVERFISGGKDAGKLALVPSHFGAGLVAFVVATIYSITNFADQVFYAAPITKVLGDVTPVVGFFLAAFLYYVLAVPMRKKD